MINASSHSRGNDYFTPHDNFSDVLTDRLGDEVYFSVRTVSLCSLEQLFEFDFVPLVSLLRAGHGHVDSSFTDHVELSRAGFALPPGLVDQSMHRVHLHTVSDTFKLILY